MLNPKSRMVTITLNNLGKWKEENSQKLDFWLDPNWTWLIMEWSLKNVCGFCVDQKSKMATNARQNSNLKPVYHLKANLARMYLGSPLPKVCFCVDQKSTIGLHGRENDIISQKLAIWLNPNWTWIIIEWPFTKFNLLSGTFVSNNKIIWWYLFWYLFIYTFEGPYYWQFLLLFFFEYYSHCNFVVMIIGWNIGLINIKQ